MCIESWKIQQVTRHCSFFPTLLLGFMDSRRGDSQETARETEVRALKKLHDWIGVMKHLRLPEPRQRQM